MPARLTPRFRTHYIRSHEIAVRAALGAGRWDLIPQSLAESLVLVVGGAVLGFGLAFTILRGLLALAPEGLPVAVSVAMDSTVLLFTVLAAMAAGILFGVAPAWQISHSDQYELLKEGGRANTAGLGRQHLRASLVVAEVALGPGAACRRGSLPARECYWKR
jgi:predicted lysophospholipase L1 biosynthesis ABC-type transport system permease subunit